MSRPIFLTIFLLALAHGALIAAQARGERALNRLAGPVPAEVLRVVDGDTIEVRAHVWLGHEVTTLVRIAGIDTPELRGKCAAERTAARRAADGLAALLANG